MEITLDNLKMTFDERTVLNNISLNIKKNKFTGIIGPNGSGKSTLLKCMYRILQPTEGFIYIDGKELSKYSIRETAQKQAVLAQHNYYNFDFEVLDVVCLLKKA